MKSVKFLTFLFFINTAMHAQITDIWVNNGEDKVAQDDLRAHDGTEVTNSLWDGDTVILFGGRNEIVNFNIVLEAASSAATNVNVYLQQLVAADMSTIDYAYAEGEDLFDWTNRQIELFYIRYLEIKGLSANFEGAYYDERHAPKRMQRPNTDGWAVDGTDWYDRPDHNAMYPDIAVPLELNPDFTIAASTNQSIWVDIYIPKTASNAYYYGTVTVTQNGPSYNIPVKLFVYDFELPDVPYSKTMLVMGYGDVCNRYTDVAYPNLGTAEDDLCSVVRQRHFQMAHRHKISMIDGNEDATGGPAGRPNDNWVLALNGSLFTAAHGYDGPGVGVGNGVFSIGTYGGWTYEWDGDVVSEVYEHTNNWVNWFTNNSPETEYFLYLTDEPGEDQYAQINNWCSIIKGNPGVGHNLPIFITVSLLDVQENLPYINIAATVFGFGVTETWNAAMQLAKSDPSKRVYFYNGYRPSGGTFSTEEDGVALRLLPWGQYKKKIDRWFYWESTYYNNFQGGTGQTNVFSSAQTFGLQGVPDDIYGESGGNYLNGDGVLFYPGTDHEFPAVSYDIPGPIASLRLKYWRRGIQDVDYLALAAQVDPTATQNIVNTIVPKVLWEYGCAESWDPTWLRTDISWSTDPDVWEEARHQLAEIMNGHEYSAAREINNPVSEQINCYPNPASDLIYFNYNFSGAMSYKFTVTDASGREVFTINTQDNLQTEMFISFDTRKLTRGVYFYQLKAGDISKGGKFVKL